MPVVPDTIQMVPTYFGVGGVTAANVIHFRQAGGAFDQSSCDEVILEWDQFTHSVMSDDWTLDDSARFLDLSQDPPDEIFGTNNSQSGVVTGGPLPAQCAAVLSISGGGGRRRAGRIYLPGIAELSVNDNSRLDSTMVTALQSGLAQFIVDVFSNVGWALAVYSRVNGTSVPVTSVAVDDVIDTQRRRVNRLA
jgi:hypothetical protein